MNEIETKDYRTFYANQFNISATHNEVILRILRLEPETYIDGIPQGLIQRLEAQVIVNPEVLKELHYAIGKALEGITSIPK